MARIKYLILSEISFTKLIADIYFITDKIIVFNKSDFAWAEKYAALVSPGCKLYLQPEWDKAHIITPSIIDYIKKNPQWELSLQIHKYINVP